MRFTSFIFILVSTITSYGQSFYSRSHIDSLTNVLKNQTGEQSVNTLLHLSETYCQFELDTALEYANLAKKEAIKNNYEWGFCKGIYCEKLIYLKNKPIRTVISGMQMCTDWFARNGYEKDAIKSQIIYANCIEKLDGVDAAKSQVDKALRMAQELNDPTILGLAWININTVYKKIQIDDNKYPNSLDSALFYFNLVQDSLNIIKVNLRNVNGKIGSPESIECAHESLVIGKRWNNLRITSLANNYIGLGCFITYNRDSAFYYMNNAIDDLSRLKNLFSLSESYAKVSFMHIQSSNLKMAIEFLDKALEIAIDLDDISNQLHLKNQLAECYMLMEKYDLSIQYALEALEMANFQKDEVKIYRTQRFLANLYLVTNEYDKAKEIYDRILEWAENNLTGGAKDESYCITYCELGMYWQERGDNNEALRFFERALSHSNTQSYYQAINFKLLYFGTLLDLEEIEKANTFYLEMLASYSKQELESSAYFKFIEGRLLIKQGDLKKGAESVLNYLEDPNRGISKWDDKIGYFDLHTAYAGMGEFKKSLEALTSYNMLNDSMSASQTLNNVAQIQSEYEISLKEATIDGLKKEQALNILEQEQQKHKLRLRQSYIIVLALVILFISVFAFMLLRRTKLKKEQEKARLKANLELENVKALQKAETAEIKNLLFANISHEFRTPLTLIQLPIEKQLATDPEANKPLFNGVLKNTKQLLKMIDELMDLAKMETGEVELNKSMFNLSPFLTGLKSNFKPLFLEKNIAFSVKNELEFARFNGDENRLKIVLNNLLKNAFDHTPVNGEVQCIIKSSKNDTCLTISVLNSGTGILEKDLPHIFDRYYRGDTTNYVGNGIGLSLCKQIVELHKGKITASNTKNNKTCFEFEIPGELLQNTTDVTLQSITDLYDDNLLDYSKNANSKNNTIQKEKLPKILLVEDNEEMKGIIFDVLKNDFALHHASNGEIGEEMAIKLQPDLIISDVMMPKKDGFELLKTLKSSLETSHIPIIMLTAKADSASTIKGFEENADAYITKPFNYGTLSARIHNLLRQRKQLQSLFQKNPLLLSNDINCTKTDAQFIDNARKILEANYSNGDFMVNEFCQELALNRNSVYNKIKALTNQNTSEYIRNFRLEKSAISLLDLTQTVADVCTISGFNNSQTFNKVFKDRFGTTPSQFRQNQLKRKR